MTKRTNPSDLALSKLRAFGLAYPGAHTKSPWPGHLDLAVKDKTFAYLSIEGEPFSIGCKLPHSNNLALELPFAEPTGYGLGKSGWVTAKIAPGEDIPLDIFHAWIDESYRAQAPKKLVAELEARETQGGASSAKTSAQRTPTKKGLAKKAATTKSSPAKRTTQNRPAPKKKR
jgi:hypothetical protein